MSDQYYWLKVKEIECTDCGLTEIQDIEESSPLFTDGLVNDDPEQYIRTEDL